MGQIMGARAQTFKGKLIGGKASSELIIRSESVANSNEAAKMILNFTDINNMSGGCMGMCAEVMPWKLEVQKNVTGTDTFVTVWTHSI